MFDVLAIEVAANSTIEIERILGRCEAKFDRQGEELFGEWKHKRECLVLTLAKKLQVNPQDLEHSLSLYHSNNDTILHDTYLITVFTSPGYVCYVL